jgi:hypothetical protein
LKYDCIFPAKIEIKKVWPKLEFNASMNPASNHAIFDLINAKYPNIFLFQFLGK